MNEKAEQILLEMMQKVIDGADAIEEFGVEHVPDVINQLLMWKMAESIIYFMIGVSLVVCFFPLRKLFHKKIISNREDLENKARWSCTYGGASDSYNIAQLFNYIMPSLIVSFGFLFVVNNLIWIKILIAPKLYLFEYAAALIK